MCFTNIIISDVDPKHSNFSKQLAGLRQKGYLHCSEEKRVRIYGVFGTKQNDKTVTSREY